MLVLLSRASFPGKGASTGQVQMECHVVLYLKRASSLPFNSLCSLFVSPADGGGCTLSRFFLRFTLFLLGDDMISYGKELGTRTRGGFGRIIFCSWELNKEGRGASQR